PLVSAFLDNKMTDVNKAPLNAGSYSFKDLLARKVLVDNKNITANDRVIAASFYGGTITLRTNNWFEDAYVHGTVGFALMDSTKFIVTANGKRVDAEVGALDDNWDLSSNSPTARLVNNLLYAAGFGVYNNMTIALEYYGPGKRLSISR